MTQKIPLDVRDQMRAKLWLTADELGWSKLGDAARAAWYENWAKDKEIGGVLSHFMDPRLVRVYIKDSLLKPYIRQRLENNLSAVIAVLGLAGDVQFKRAYVKPHGRMLLDKRIVCWGNSRDWKSILFAVYERTYGTSEPKPYAALLFETGTSVSEGTRAMIKEASDRLGIERLLWVD
jgi:hypothetical protein